MDAAKLERLTNEVLRFLDWTSLRTRYRQTGDEWKARHRQFLFEPLDHRKVENWREIAAIAATLNSVPAIADRMAELKRAGLTAALHSYEESGFSALVLIVTFDETGQSALEEG